MPWPVTINGNTYNESDFSPYGYVNAFPNIVADIAEVGNATDAISNGNVSNTMLVDVAQNTIKGRISSGTGDPEDLTAAQVKTMLDIADVTSSVVNNKSDSGHTHDDRYYTEAEVDSLLAGKSSTSHLHDDRYYTEAEVNSLLSGKQNTGSYITTNSSATLGSLHVESGETGIIRARRSVSSGDTGVAPLYADRHLSNGSAIILERNGSNVGSISVTTSSTTYNTSSDGRLKPERQDFDAAEILSALAIVRHNWLHEPDAWAYGVIAQDTQAVFPQAVAPGSAAGPDEEGFSPWGVDYSKFVPLLLKAWQQDRDRLAAIESRLAVLEAQ